MQTIWKYPLSITSEQTLKMPVGARVLSIQFQCDTLCMWALVDGSLDQESRTFRIYGTGHPIEPELNSSLVYLATVQESNRLVWHVFEKCLTIS